MLDTRTRLELHLHQLEERLVEMDAKFEHNIAAMNELLQKNLKVCPAASPARACTRTHAHAEP